nr:zinc finger, CCHC-type [Tanacetum cinerariifolium]
MSGSHGGSADSPTVRGRYLECTQFTLFLGGSWSLVGFILVSLKLGPSPSTPSSLYKEVRGKGFYTLFFQQLGPGVETGVHGVHRMKNVFGLRWNCKVFKEIVKLRFFRSTYLVNRSPSSAIGLKKPVDMLRFFGWLASIKQGIHEPVKVKCIFLVYHKRIVGNKLWRLDDVTSKVVLYRNTGFNESWEYKKTFIDSGVGLQEIQTQNLIYNHLARDREQHLSCELFGYREDINEAAFADVVVEKIYAHESPTFNNTVACEVISKWKAGMKDDMDAWLDVFVLSNNDMFFSCGCKAEIWATKGLLNNAKGNVLGMEVVKNQSGYTMRVSQSRFYNRKLVQTLLEGQSILLLKGSLSRDCDVEKNGSLKANLQDMKALSTTEVGYVTFTKAWKKKMWLK